MAPLDLSPIASIPNLETLGLEECGLTEVTALAGATGLQFLSLMDNELIGLDGLENLPVLAYLDASSNKIADLAPLADHVALRLVDLADNAITDLGPLVEAPWVLTGCASLRLMGNPLDAVSLETTLPTMCGHEVFIEWDQGQCAGGRC